MLVLCFTLSKDHVIPIPTAVPILIAATRKIGRFLASGSPHKYIRASKEGCSPIRVGSSHGRSGKQGPLASRRVGGRLQSHRSFPRSSSSNHTDFTVHSMHAERRGPWSEGANKRIPAGHPTKGPSCVTSSRTYGPSTGRFSTPTGQKTSFSKKVLCISFLSRRGAARHSATWALRRQRVVELPNEGGKAT
jgi:hypothetical protein